MNYSNRCLYIILVIIKKLNIDVKIIMKKDDLKNTIEMSISVFYDLIKKEFVFND